MSQNLSLRTARFSFVPLGSDLPCANLKNWLKNGETSSDKAARASNPALVHPTGRYVLKVWTQGKEKIMINVCTEPSHLLDPRTVPGGFLLPHSASEPRKDVDLKKQPCLVVDVTFGEEAFTLAEQSALFIQYLHQAALNAAQTALKVNLQRDRVATPKLKCKGAPESFEMSTALSERVQVTEEDSLIQVKLIGLTQTLPGDRVRYNLAQDYLEIDLKSHCVVVHLPSKVQGLKEEPRLALNRPELVFKLLKMGNKAVKAGFLLVNQPVAVVDDEMDQIVQQMDALETGMETGSNSSGTSDEEKAASSDNTPEDEDFVDCSRNNNSTETKQTDSLDNEEMEDTTAKHNNNLNKRHLRIMAVKTRSMSESSDDWSMCQSPCKSILKGSFSMSGDLAASLELSDLSEETTQDVGSVSSVKKSVSFSDVISKQLFRPDSSILGQRKKNQRKARNKRKATQRKHSESEDVNSEAECGTPKEGQEMMFDIDM